MCQRRGKEQGWPVLERELGDQTGKQRVAPDDFPLFPDLAGVAGPNQTAQWTFPMIKLAIASWAWNRTLQAGAVQRCFHSSTVATF